MPGEYLVLNILQDSVIVFSTRVIGLKLQKHLSFLYLNPFFLN